MSPTMALARPSALLIDWLREKGIDHEIHEHELAYTALHTARMAGVLPATFAKVVVVATADERRVMLVLDATDHVDLAKARRALDVGHLRVLDESELGELAPDAEIGAMPAVGCLYGLPMYADHAVAQNARISFNAGSHGVAVRVDERDWAEATGVVYADLARSDDYRLDFLPF